MNQATVFAANISFIMETALMAVAYVLVITNGKPVRYDCMIE